MAELYRNLQPGQRIGFERGNSLKLKATNYRTKNIDIALNLNLEDGDQLNIKRANGNSISFNTSAERIRANSAPIYINSNPRNMRFNFDLQDNSKTVINEILDKITQLRNLVFPKKTNREVNQSAASILEDAKHKILHFRDAILKLA